VRGGGVSGSGGILMDTRLLQLNCTQSHWNQLRLPCGHCGCGAERGSCLVKSLGQMGRDQRESIACCRKGKQQTHCDATGQQHDFQPNGHPVGKMHLAPYVVEQTVEAIERGFCIVSGTSACFSHPATHPVMMPAPPCTFTLSGYS
jgi:hypothetical protein